jgi:hypothetical protein
MYLNFDGFWRWCIALCKLVLLDIVHRLNIINLRRFGTLLPKRCNFIMFRRWTKSPPPPKQRNTLCLLSSFWGCGRLLVQGRLRRRHAKVCLTNFMEQSLEKLISGYLMNKFLVFLGTWWSITVIRKVRIWTPSGAIRIQSTFSNPIY